MWKWILREKRPGKKEALVLSDHPQLRSGGGQSGPDEWVGATLCVSPAPGLIQGRLLHEQVTSVEDRVRRPTSGRGPLKLHHFNYPTGEQAPVGEAGPPISGKIQVAS